MSIRDEVNGLCEQGRLFRLRPIFLDPGLRERREIYVSEEVNARFSGPWDDPSVEIRCGRAQADLEAFVSRDPIVVARDPRRAGASYMSRLIPPRDEVWDIRSYDPTPGIRVLGRFAEKDVFIALTWEVRRLLNDFDSPEWRTAIRRCATAWINLFHVYEPLRGDYFADYISDAIFDREP